MGQKSNPIILRIGGIRNWNSRWFSKKEYPNFLKQDILIKKYLKNKYREASIAKIEVERSASNFNVIIHTAKPGIIIGRGGQGIEELKKDVKSRFLNKKNSLNINIKEVTSPNLVAELVLQGIIADIEKRIPYRRAVKQALGRAEKAGAQGAKVLCSGRLNGVEIARRESLAKGKLPLHTLRADIDYSRGAAQTTYGKVGVKVWIYKGEKFSK